MKLMDYKVWALAYRREIHDKYELLIVNLSEAHYT